LAKDIWFPISKFLEGSDANQKWDVDEAIKNIQQLSDFNPWWIEEPTTPDDILGHKTIAEAVRPIKIATGEHCSNRVIFKQFITSGATDICQIDSCRLGGVTPPDTLHQKVRNWL
jgi:L-fuconate dehydratase